MDMMADLHYITRLPTCFWINKEIMILENKYINYIHRHQAGVLKSWKNILYPVLLNILIGDFVMEPTWAEAIGVLVIVAIIIIIPIVSCLRSMAKHDREVDELYKRKF